MSEVTETPVVEARTVAETLSYAKPDASHLMLMANRYQENVECLPVIDCDELAQDGANTRKQLKALEKTLTEQRLNLTRPLDAVKKGIMDMYNPALERIGELIKAVDSRLIGWEQEKERRRIKLEAERREAERAAREAAEKEAARIRQEAAAKAAEANKAAQEAIQNGDVQTAMAATQQAVEVGAIAQAQANNIHAAALSTVAAPPPPEKTKISGLSVATSWDFEVIDLAQLIKYVAANVDARPGLVKLLAVDSVALRSLVRAEKEQFAMPGVRAIPKHSARSR